MDSFEFDSVKAEKSKAMERYQIELKLKKFLYVFEIIVAVVFVPWFFNRIPAAAKLAGGYLWYLVTGFFRSTFYVFLLTNAMVFAVAISYYLKNDSNTANSDIYDEFVNASESLRRFAADDEYTKSPELKAPPVEESVSFEDKEVIYSSSAVSGVDSAIVTDAKPKREVVVVVSETKISKRAEPEKEFRRSATELSGRKLETKIKKKQQIELRRSATVKYGRSPMHGGDYEPPRRSMEEMSSEEFRSTIESFIAMQKKMQLEETKKEAGHGFRQKITRPCLAVAVNQN